MRTLAALALCATLLAGCSAIEPWDEATLSKGNMQFAEASAFSAGAGVVSQVESGRLKRRIGGRATAAICTACSP